MDYADQKSLGNDHFHSIQNYSAMRDSAVEIFVGKSKKDDRTSHIGEVTSSYRTAGFNGDFDDNSLNNDSMRPSLIENQEANQEDLSTHDPMNLRKNNLNHLQQSLETAPQSSAQRSTIEAAIDVNNQTKSTKLRCPRCNFEAYTEVSSHLKTKGKVFVTLLTITLMWPCAVCVFKNTKYRQFIHECTSCGHVINKKQEN